MKIKDILANVLVYALMPFYMVFDRLMAAGRAIKTNPKKALWIGLPLMMYEGSVIWLIAQYFNDPKKDTLSLTSVGFAMCIGIASVCFSWLKTLDTTNEKDLIDTIKKVGEIVFGIGLFFLLATALKYGSLTIYPTYKMTFVRIIGVIMSLSSVVLYMIAFYTSGKVFRILLTTIYDRNHQHLW